MTIRGDTDTGEPGHTVGTGCPGEGFGAREVAMPVIVVTRLRLKDPALFDEFFASAVAVVEQAQSSEGNLGADVLAEATTPTGPAQSGNGAT